MANYVSKQWADELVEYPYRYKITHADTTEELVNIVAQPGNVLQSGDVFEAANWNNMESRIDAGFDSCGETWSGTTDPTADQGKDGDFYIKTVTESNVTTVAAMFVKIAGAWLEIQTGGGSSLPASEGRLF